jgi:hypothetical protein
MSDSPSEDTLRIDSLIGKWALVGERKAVLDFRKNELYFLDIRKGCKYKFQNDTFILIFPEGREEKFSMRMKGLDTLVWENKVERQIYYRVKG